MLSGGKASPPGHSLTSSAKELVRGPPSFKARIRCARAIMGATLHGRCKLVGTRLAAPLHSLFMIAPTINHTGAMAIRKTIPVAPGMPEAWFTCMDVPRLTPRLGAGPSPNPASCSRLFLMGLWNRQNAERLRSREAPLARRPARFRTRFDTCCASLSDPGVLRPRRVVGYLDLLG